MLQTASNRPENATSSMLESTVARLHAEVRKLQRSLHARSAELAGADAHIALLEEKVLKLKEAQRDLKRLKWEQQTLRKSTEGRIGRGRSCLKMRRAGYLIVYTPFGKLYRHASDSGSKVDICSSEIMRERWSEVLARDPYYNSNLSRERANFSLGS
jgi:hypothetical protein